MLISLPDFSNSVVSTFGKLLQPLCCCITFEWQCLLESVLQYIATVLIRKPVFACHYFTGVTKKCHVSCVISRR